MARIKNYKVLVDDNFHFMDDSERYESGVYATFEEAVSACKEIVDSTLNESLYSGTNPAELWSAYVNFGEDPFILPLESKSIPDMPHFSAWDYAKEKCAKYISGELPLPVPPQELPLSQIRFVGFDS